MSENLAAQDALRQLQEAFKGLEKEEMATIKSIQKEVDDAVKAGAVSDAKLEFCYTIKFSRDRISNPEVLAACEAYIKAVEG